MRGRRDRLIQPGAVHDRVLRQDLDVTTAADIARQRRDETTHETQRRQPPAVVGKVPSGYDGLDETLRVLTNAGVIDDRTTRVGDGDSTGDAIPTATTNSGAGTAGSPTATVPDGNDRVGRLVIVTGTNPAAASVAAPAVVATVTFGRARDDTAYYVHVSPLDPTASPVPFYVDWDDTPSKSSRWRLQTTATLTASSTYHLLYEVAEVI